MRPNDAVHRRRIRSLLYRDTYRNHRFLLRSFPSLLHLCLKKVRNVCQTCFLEDRVSFWSENVLSPRRMPLDMTEFDAIIVRDHHEDFGLACEALAYLVDVDVFALVTHSDSPL